MTEQERLNAISVLNGTIDPLMRAGKAKEIDIVVKKMIELIGRI